MNIYDIFKNRYSVRSYKSNDVELEKLEVILNAARMAPTAANRQAFRVIVAKTEGRKDLLKKVYNRDWFVQAPLIIAVCSLPDTSWTRKDDSKNYSDVDAAIVMDHIIMAATAEGLGTCWIAAFDPISTRDVFELTDELTPVVLTPLGYAADTQTPKKRKSLSEIVKYI